jgi:hypothetical protein
LKSLPSPSCSSTAIATTARRCTRPPYAPESVYPADAVKIVRGDPTTWKLKRNPRFTCRECGTRLFIDVLGRNLRGVNGFLLPPGEFQPAFHVQCQFAVRPIVDELPHYKGMPAGFGGSDERVGW